MTANARGLVVVLWVGAACGCGDERAPAAVRGSAELATATARPSPAPSPTATAPVPATASRAQAVAQPGAATTAPQKAIDDEELKSEEPESNPYSESVTLKLAIAPPVKAQVTWGAKTLARVEPGKMEAEITRPRGSGPVDVEVKADGFLPHHTRLYADRNDKVNVRLCRPEDAPNLFGYRRSLDGKKAEAQAQREPKNP